MDLGLGLIGRASGLFKEIEWIGLELLERVFMEKHFD